MKRIFTSKQKRKQAEIKIIKDMQSILSSIEDKQNDDVVVDKEKVMSVLTKFLHLKKTTKIH